MRKYGDVKAVSGLEVGIGEVERVRMENINGVSGSGVSLKTSAFLWRLKHTGHLSRKLDI